MFDLGKNIKELRKKAGLSQLELAERLGVSRSAVSSWEVNRNEPNIQDISKMSALFRCPLNMLIDPDNMDYHFLLQDEEQLLKDYREASPDLQSLCRQLLSYYRIFAATMIDKTSKGEPRIQELAKMIIEEEEKHHES